MIQRKQTLYLVITIIALAILTLGSDVFITTVTKKDQFELMSHGNVYGVQKDLIITGELDQSTQNKLKSVTGKANIEGTVKGIPTFYFPFYSIAIILTVLAVATLFSYKNLKRQHRLALALFIFTLLLLFIGGNILSYALESHSVTHIEGEVVRTRFELGFYCICIAAAFSFLAYRGVLRDYKLIRSIDRLR